MKTIPALSLLLLGTLAHAAPLKRAEFTKVVNDVKTLEEQKPPLPAKVGEVVAGRTSVTTGVQSRAELKFEDNTITRLGANSVFSIEQGTRTVDLKQGVLLMQVPKQLGGAKIRTASVTAAVTGTTVMIEYMPDGWVKMIVLEGSMDVFSNTDPSNFRTLKAGDMIIMKPDAKMIPEPVQVDLVRLKKTSKLTDGNEFGDLGNQDHLRQADMHQGDLKRRGELKETPLTIPGLGPRVLVIDPEKPRDVGNGFGVRDSNTPPGPGGPGGPRGPAQGDSKFGRAPVLGGRAVLNNDTVINTDPTITTEFNGTIATGAGKIFRAGVDGAGLGAAAFGEVTRTLPDEFVSTPSLDSAMKDAGPFAVFRFDEAYLIGGPTVLTTGGPTNLLLASEADFYLTPYHPTSEGAAGSGPWDLSTSSLANLWIASKGNIVIDAGYRLAGTTQNLLIYTQRAIDPTIDEGAFSPNSAGDITVTGSTNPALSFPGGTVDLHAARDLSLYSTSFGTGPAGTVIQGGNVNLSADKNVNIGSGVIVRAANNLNITSTLGSITVQNSSQLRRLADTDPTQISLLAQQGNIAFNGGTGGSDEILINGTVVQIEATRGSITMSGVNLNSDLVKVHTLAPNGSITIGNSTLTATDSIRLFAEGSNGTIQFVANSKLDGKLATTATILAAPTVKVNPGVSVSVTRPSGLDIYSNNHLYNDGTNGNFTNGSTPLNFVPVGSSGPHKRDFDSRPGL